MKPREAAALAAVANDTRETPTKRLVAARLALEFYTDREDFHAYREHAMLSEMNEAANLLADGLGYVNDPQYGWVTGDHTVVTLAMEARTKLCAEDPR